VIGSGISQAVEALLYRLRELASDVAQREDTDGRRSGRDLRQRLCGEDADKDVLHVRQWSDVWQTEGLGKIRARMDDVRRA